jgi:hypothetical protein
MFSCSPSGLARPDAASQGRRLFEAKELLDRLVHFDLDPAWTSLHEDPYRQASLSCSTLFHRV